MYLDRIPGLSEHFIYANDDTMLNRSLEQRDFFSEEGKPMVWMYKPSRKSFTPKNGGDILSNHVITDWEQTLVRAWELYREKMDIQFPSTRLHTHLTPTQKHFSERFSKNTLNFMFATQLRSEQATKYRGFFSPTK